MQTSPTLSALAASSQSADYQRTRLASAMALTTHTVNRPALFSMAIKRVAWAALFFLLCVPCAAATVTVVQKDQMAAAAWGGGFTVLFFLLGLWLVSAAISRYTDAITDMEACHDGLRWSKGKKQNLTLWSEIVDVDVSSAVPQTYGTGLVGAMQAWNSRATPVINHVTIKLRSGEKLVIYADTLSDFVRLVHTVHERHIESLKEAQHANVGAAFPGAGGR